MAFGDRYTQGSVSTDTGSPADPKRIIGHGTLWSATAVAGDLFWSGGIAAPIASVDSDTQLTLATDWPGSALDEASYSIEFLSGLRHDATDLAGRVRDLINRLRVFDAASPVFSVLTFGVNDPPGDSVVEDRYVIGTSPTGGFVGHDNEIVEKTETGWLFRIPEHGWQVVDEAENKVRTWTGSAWEEVTGAAGPAGEGIQPDVTVNEITSTSSPAEDDRDAHDSDPEGTVVLVASEGKIYVRLTSTAGVWSDGVLVSGDSAYVYIAYASDASGSDFTTTFSAALDYIAFKSTATPITSPSASDFTGLWKNYKGATGPAGSTGAAGADGADGAKWFGGTTDPDSGTGADGDFYIQVGDGSTGIIGDVWTKASGSWSVTGNIRGASGAGTGDVVGPAGATAGNIPTFSGTSGKLIADSGIAVDTDASLTANSDSKLATQKAVKAYVDALLAANDVVVLKGAIDCSANPNYPAADAGHFYKVSVAGKIGGASGINVEAGDSLYCVTDSSASGNQATVGANWVVVQVNIDGAMVGVASSTDGAVMLFDGTGGKKAKAATGSGLAKLTSGVLSVAGSGDADSAVSDASDTTKGKVELATSTEVATGTDTVRAVTPAGAASVYSPITRVPNVQTGTTYTFVLSDSGKICWFSNTSAVTVTVPPNSSVAFPIGTQIDLGNINTGKVTIAQGSGVSILSLNSNKSLAGTYAGATLVKTSTDGWVLIGNLAA